MASRRLRHRGPMVEVLSEREFLRLLQGMHSSGPIVVRDGPPPKSSGPIVVRDGPPPKSFAPIVVRQGPPPKSSGPIVVRQGPPPKAASSDSAGLCEMKISSPMTPTEAEKMFSQFKDSIAAVKGDRDQMVSERQEFPIPRFIKLVSQLMQFSAVELGGGSVTRKDVAAFKERMSDFFLKKHSVGSKSVSYFSLVSDVFSEFCKDLLSESKKINKNAAELLFYSLGLFHNLTDCSPNFSRQVANNAELMRAFLKMIQKFSEGHLQGTLHDAIVRLLSSATGVVYNLVRLSDSNNVMQVRKFSFIEAVKPLLKSIRVGIKDHAMLILIFAASENDAKECCCESATINFLMVKLKAALASKNHKDGGYSDVELMEAIRKLAVIDENKKILARLKCLQLMKDVLEKSDDDEVVSLAFAILSQLAFDPDNAKWIDKEMQRLLDSKFLKSPNSHLREAARNLKWIVESKTVHTPPPTPQGARERPQSAVLKRPASARPSPAQKHIMVSYNHASKDFVKKLVQTLESADLGKVWVDWSDMKESWLDDMAYAVENAWVVLVCVSLKYKDSENCQLEAQYAKKRGVSIVPLKVEKWNPDGWLGILIASLIYYDFTKEDSSGQIMAKLLTALRGKLTGKDSVDAEAPIRAASSQPAQSEPASEPAFSTWSCAEVQRWCEENGIPGDKCADLDGDQLCILKDIRQSEQAMFLRELQEEFKFSLKEKAAFIKAFDAL